MNQDKIIMSKKEIKYSNIMTMVVEEILSLTDACIRLGISYRHGIRIKQRYMESSCSPSALMHKSRGRKRDSGKDKNAILALYHSKYRNEPQK